LNCAFLALENPSIKEGSAFAEVLYYNIITYYYVVIILLWLLLLSIINSIIIVTICINVNYVVSSFFLSVCLSHSLSLSHIHHTHTHTYTHTYKMLYISDVLFALLFTIEMLIKMAVFGIYIDPTARIGMGKSERERERRERERERERALFVCAYRFCCLRVYVLYLYIVICFTLINYICIY